MVSKAIEISEAELDIIKVLWQIDKPMTAQEICDKLINKKWKYTTTSTLLSRLVEKGGVGYEKNGKSYLYYPIIKKEDYKQSQTKNLVSKLYDGSVKNLAVSLFQTGEMSEEDIAQIKEMFNL